MPQGLIWEVANIGCAFPDCQWLQQLHTYGLLAGSFRPSDQICILRSYIRQRDSLIKNATTHVQRMQKALIQNWYNSPIF